MRGGDAVAVVTLHMQCVVAEEDAGGPSATCEKGTLCDCKVLLSSGVSVEAVLDSGATHTLSAYESDFAKIAPRPTVALTAVDGKVARGGCVGYVGTLKSNSMGLTSAVYIPNIPVGRLLSTGQLIEVGWEVRLSAGECGSYLKHGGSGEVVQVDTEGRLPRVEWRFEPSSTGTVEALAVTGRRASSKLLEHRRGGHLSLPSLRVQCPDCAVAKGGKTGANPQRGSEYCSNVPLHQLNADFYGPLEESVRGSRVLLVVICDAISHVWVMPLRHRSECVEEIKKLIDGVRAVDSETVGEKVVHWVRTDNDTVFRSKEWSSMLEKLCVGSIHSVPYTPQMNGCVERFMRTLGEALRANLNGVDKRLWCFASQYIAWTWNRTARPVYSRAPEYNGMTPLESRRQRSAVVTPSDGAGDVQATKWGPIKRRFGCLAHILVQPREKVPKLHAKWRMAVFLGYSAHNSAWAFGYYASDSRTRGGTRWAVYETRDAKFLEDRLVSDISSLMPGSKCVSVAEGDLLELMGHASSGGAMHSLGTGIVGNKRERPFVSNEGSKRHEGEPGELCAWSPDEHVETPWADVPVDVYAHISVAEALRSPDAESWEVAMAREKEKLEGAGTWRALTPEEEEKNKKVVPVALLLTRKRGGTFKARACVLGNLVNTDGLNVYAPVVAMAAHRYLLTEAASEGNYIKAFDIDCAFLNADLREEVFVTLPEVWRKEGEKPVRRLVKALYGLPQSPRAWYKRYESFVKQVGWEQNTHELGLWRRESRAVDGQFVKMSVYVDDIFVAGPCRREVESLVGEILAEFPGKIIEPTQLKDGSLLWDALGADFTYNRSRREMSLTMASYVQKLAEKFGVAMPATSPNFSEEDLAGESEGSDFKFRELVGALQWVATVARPDIARAANLLSTYVDDRVTIAKEGCATRVLRFLLGAKEKGLKYTPSGEKSFQGD